MNGAFSAGSPPVGHNDHPSQHLSAESMERPMTKFFASASLDHTEARGAAIESISRLISGLVGSITKRMRDDRTRRELMDLDDHMLSDIGLSRNDLRARHMNELNRINWSGRGHPSGM
jgi:uncharacterized protein YjiS (DUF1127 family)